MSPMMRAVCTWSLIAQQYKCEEYGSNKAAELCRRVSKQELYSRLNRQQTLHGWLAQPFACSWPEYVHPPRRCAILRVHTDQILTSFRENTAPERLTWVAKLRSDHVLARRCFNNVTGDENAGAVRWVWVGCPRGGESAIRGHRRFAPGVIIRSFDCSASTQPRLSCYPARQHDGQWRSSTYVWNDCCSGLAQATHLALCCLPRNKRKVELRESEAEQTFKSWPHKNSRRRLLQLPLHHRQTSPSWPALSP